MTRQLSLGARVELWREFRVLLVVVLIAQDRQPSETRRGVSGNKLFRADVSSVFMLV